LDSILTQTQNEQKYFIKRKFIFKICPEKIFPYIYIKKRYKMQKTKHTASMMIRLPQEIKDKFEARCDAELIDMSTKVRQLIAKELGLFPQKIK
jgi:hypothetical protein